MAETREIKWRNYFPWRPPSNKELIKREEEEIAKNEREIIKKLYSRCSPREKAILMEFSKEREAKIKKLMDSLIKIFKEAVYFQ